MITPVLATKLYIPPPRPNQIPRPRLIDRLNEGLSARRALTLIAAPTGFGKSTLVSEWLARCGRPAAWLSLDENDNDPARFWLYFINALQRIAPGVGAGLLEIVQTSQLPPIEPLLTALINEIAAIPDDFILVLDDYHVIDAKLIGDGLAFVVEHLPPQMHLVITTREDPVLPIPRLRARGRLTEVRVADLRFTPAEASEFLNRTMALNLSGEEVAALESRTEGWIAGLQLAALALQGTLSMQGNQDVAGFLRAFAGDNRYIMDYLVEEVLQRQPESIRNFLLQTSILERLNGPLCDAVILQPGGQARLEALQRGNFFLIPLDERRHWYRYHHLFADVLRLHLVAEQPELFPALHRRASKWYEENGSVNDAIRHALVAEDFERAANLIERSMPEMSQHRQEATLLRWFRALPDEIFHNRPVLAVHYVGTLLQTGHTDDVESRLRDAERWLNTPVDTREPPIFVSEEDFRRLPGLVAMYHAGIALIQSDVTNTIKYARQVLELAGEKDDFLRGASSSLLGLAFWTRGDLEAAHQLFSEGMAHLHKVGFISDVIGGGVTLADIRIAQGRLREAMRIYQSGLRLATEQGTPTRRGAADMHVGLSELYRERNDLNSATQHLLKSKELGELNGLPKNPYRWRVAKARIQAAEGDLDGALDLLEEAEPLYVGDFSPNVRPLSALKVRVWITQGRLKEALGWARDQNLSAKDDLSYLREFEHITLARLLLAQYQINGNESAIREATGLLDRLLKAAQAGERMGSALEILLLQALVHKALDDISSALPPLQQALVLAEPEGYVRIFLDEGPEMAYLLREAVARGIAPGYARELLEALPDEQDKSAGRSGPFPAAHPLIEPLSQREIDLLRLFQTELSGPEIAEELVIALSTVRTHTKSIYAKLNVNSRRAAVKRAIDLGLI
jgi:LuxR family transcriptional regulator, maltose regulon positive regulatory protein